MSAVSQLINVSYKDKTNYTAEVGGDIMGIVLVHPWGPCGKLLVLNKQEFFETYPEEHFSTQVFGSNTDLLYSYAQVKQAFMNGLKQVEVYRIPIKAPFKEISFNGTTLVVKETPSEVITDSYELGDSIDIGLKYNGVPGKSIKIEASASTDTWNIVVSVDGSTVESFEGVWSDEKTLNGEDVGIRSKLEASEFIKINKYCPDSKTWSFESSSSVASEAVLQVPSDTVHTQFFKESFENAVSIFSDMRRSTATILASSTSDDSMNTSLVQAADSAQDRIAVIGRNIKSSFSKEEATTELTAVKAQGNMFFTFIYGSETIKVNKMSVKSNCVGGFIGRTAAIASQYRTNQPASAFTYGAYNGTLTESLSFEEVLALHEEGAGGIFNDVNGPLIWCVRTPYRIQTSYFAKFNVIRVLSEILRQVFPICLQAIHTDAAANESTASDYETKFTNILDYEVSQQNIKSDSVAICTGSINSDKNTKGGKIFNLLLSLHFIGLVEKVNISVVATDSSVSAEIV